MGKKRLATTEDNASEKAEVKSTKVSSKKRIESGILYVQSTYNNTIVLLTDKKGNVIMQSSAGALGFRGAKKVHLLQLLKLEKH
jgi:small subunit ribosomal protein S11